jgi:RPA family protein
MEPAERVFARDFAAARHTADSGGDSYVVTPGGAWCRSLFIVGAVTERRGSGDLVQARVADPTGTFRVTADWQSPDAVETLGCIEPPAFVAVTGRAVLAGSGPRAQAAVEVEALCAVSRTVRDLWVLETAGATLDRLEALRAGNDERTATALRLYRTTEEDTLEMAGMVRTALASVRPDITVGEIVPVAGRDLLLAALEEEGGMRGVSLDDAVAAGVRSGLSAREARAALEELLAAGECYRPASGMIKLL